MKRFLIIYSLAILLFAGCEQPEMNIEDFNDNIPDISVNSTDFVENDEDSQIDPYSQDETTEIDDIGKSTEDNEISKEDEEKLNACNLYVDYLGDEGENIEDIFGYSSEDMIFSLEYIDEDDIPELIVGTKDISKGDIYILSCSNGEVVCYELEGVEYIDIERKHSIVSSYSSSLNGGYIYRTYELNGEGELDFLFSHEEYVDLYSDDFDNRLTQVYTVGSDNVTYEDYIMEYEKKISDDNEIISWNPYDETDSYYSCNRECFSKLRKGEL